MNYSYQNLREEMCNKIEKIFYPLINLLQFILINF